jgi:dynein heavy chain, axonemal
LFPGADIPDLINPDLQARLSEVFIKSGLKLTKPFEDKVLQLHETLKVRFGVMIVGATMGGKSTILKTLKDTYLTEGGGVDMVILNPKSISMNELYGEFDPLTQTWSDGLASKVMREFVAKENNDRKWVVFDGPVDSL